MRAYVLWGVGGEKHDYMEKLLAEVKTIKELEDAKNKAIKEGYRCLRVVDGMRPDFSSTIEIL